jgi:cation-transporting P-type ATPase E
VLIIFVEPPTAFWAGGDELSGDWRPTMVAIVLAIAYVIIMLVPSLRTTFELSALALRDWFVILIAIIVWTLALRGLRRTHAFIRLFRLHL